MFDYTDPEFRDEYYEQMRCDGLEESSLEDAGYGSGFDILDDEASEIQAFDAAFESNYDVSENDDAFDSYNDDFDGDPF